MKPADEPYEYKKKIVLDQEKSKLSLSQLYEQEYIKQQQVCCVYEITNNHVLYSVNKCMSVCLLLLYSRLYSGEHSYFLC